MQIDGELHNIVHFLQLSDLHTSSSYPTLQGAALNRFLSGIVNPIIRPSFTIVTGDLCDGRSGPTDIEWGQYQQILSGNGVYDCSMWRDVRGNHDAFWTLNPKDSSNLFQKSADISFTSICFA